MSPRRRPASRPGRELYSSGTPWEPKVGYSRAVRVGPRVYVSGTTSTGPDGSIVGTGDAYLQTARALDNIETALRALGSRRESVVRLRVFVTDIADFAAVARALAERYREVRPACTLVEVSHLVDPALRVEVEADAEDAEETARGRPGKPEAKPSTRARAERSARVRRRPS